MLRSLLISLVAAGGLTYAHPSSAGDDICAGFGRIAEAVMQRRQDGLSLQSSLEATKAAASEGTFSVVEEMIMDAYEVPLFSSASYRARAIANFRDERQLACMKIQKELKQPSSGKRNLFERST